MNREGFLIATNNDGVDTAGTVEATVVATAAEAPNPAVREAVGEAVRGVNPAVRSSTWIPPGTHGDDCGKQPR
jgi:hypothetical protein